MLQPYREFELRAVCAEHGDTRRLGGWLDAARRRVRIALMATKPGEQRAPLPVGPTGDEWRAMSADARERFLLRVLEALSDPRDAMSEGRTHKKVKARSLDLLGLHFRTLGRVIYLAEEMAVVYPGEAVFTPDVLAVTDVPRSEDDERLAWVVADEGRGLDWVLEVLHRGDRKKDLVENVERYARLGIPEYFVYDRAHQRIRGHRLTAPGAKRYQPIVPQGGRYHSDVLGVDLAVEDDNLCFFHGMAELFGSDELVRRLSGMVRDHNAKAEQAEAEAERAKAEAERTKATAEQALRGLRAGVLGALSARGLAVTEAQRERVQGCEDPSVLQGWLLRALSAASAEEALGS